MNQTVSGDALHDWARPLGVDTALVNGERRRVPRVCRACLLRDDSPLADEPCDRLLDARRGGVA